MKKETFLANKKYMDGYIYYRIRGDYVLVRQVRPSKEMKQFINSL